MVEEPPVDAEFLLLIADVSGYTRFMLANRTARVHAHGIMSDLLSAVIGEVRLPLEVNKLEGDAIFMIGARQADGWEAIGVDIGRRLTGFVAAFDRKLTELASSTICDCVACQQMVTLRLKVIAHYGTATRSRVSGFDELSGVDVIVLHRLLKNEVAGSEYILLTEPAFRFLAPPGDYVPHCEHYDDVGDVPLRLRRLEAAVPASAPRTFSWRDVIRKLGYDIRYLRARTRHPT
ncbi:MAG: DUF2652 domain-containing protein [Planctomycetia bacterium]|nr:DUF2652 domain-containing protein [Planctomycetia bacterium]